LKLDIAASATLTSLSISTAFYKRDITNMQAVILLIAVLVACASAFKVIAPSRVASGARLPPHLLWPNGEFKHLLHSTLLIV
jgi:hypothetical protein